MKPTARWHTYEQDVTAAVAALSRRKAQHCALQAQMPDLFVAEPLHQKLPVPVADCRPGSCIAFDQHRLAAADIVAQEDESIRCIM